MACDGGGIAWYRLAATTHSGYVFCRFEKPGGDVALHEQVPVRMHRGNKKATAAKQQGGAFLKILILCAMPYPAFSKAHGDATQVVVKIIRNLMQ